jgi:hypothetical protein
MLEPCLYVDLALLVYLDGKINRATANLAILDIFLVFDRSIDQQGDFFPAVGALQADFDELVDHGWLTMLA